MNGAAAKKKVVICEDHEIVHTGLKLILEQSVSYELVGHARTGQELLPLLKQQSPDILILDLNLPDTDGFTLLRTVRALDKGICVVILTMYHEQHLVDRAIDEGANAYLLKNSGNEELLRALDAANLGTFYVNHQLKAELEKKRLFVDSFTQKMKLTRREMEIVRLLSLGSTTEQIADELSISPHTIDTHRKNIFRKLEINNLAALVRFAYDNKII